MPTVHLMTGLPASGKSTSAIRMVDASNGHMRRTNLDDIRAMMDNNDGSRRYTGANEETVLAVQDAAILGSVRDGFDVVVDNTHLRSRLPNRYARLLSAYDVEFVVHDFTGVPLDECIRRDAERPRSVGEAVIRRMHRRMTESPWRLATHPLNAGVAPLPYVADPALPSAVICDIDGTLANMDGRGPYDFAQVETDRVNEEVRRILKLCAGGDADGMNADEIILLSGRQSEFRPHTERWLFKHGIRYDHLFMRPAADRRPDDRVKSELFDRFVRGKYNVRFVLDDRNRVVNLWRRMGLQCWQVADGPF